MSISSSKKRPSLGTSVRGGPRISMTTTQRISRTFPHACQVNLWEMVGRGDEPWAYSASLLEGYSPYLTAGRWGKGSHCFLLLHHHHCNKVCYLMFEHFRHFIPPWTIRWTLRFSNLSKDGELVGWVPGSGARCGSFDHWATLPHCQCQWIHSCRTLGCEMGCRTLRHYC